MWWRNFTFSCNQEYLGTRTAAKARPAGVSPWRRRPSVFPPLSERTALARSLSDDVTGCAASARASRSEATANRPNGLWTVGSPEERVVSPWLRWGGSHLSAWAPVRRWPVRRRPQRSRLSITCARLAASPATTSNREWRSKGQRSTHATKVVDGALLKPTPTQRGRPARPLPRRADLSAHESSNPPLSDPVTIIRRPLSRINE